MRYTALFALVFLIGCAQVIEEDNAEQQSSVDRNWSRLSMTKADLANTDATLGIKAIELLPGETPEEAVMRVFGVVPTYDVRKLLDTHEVAETNLFDHSTDSSDSSSICNDSCPYANDGYCDEPGLCAQGTDCTDCAQDSRQNVSDVSSEHRCRFANDGHCDEPTYCPVGTDTNDCSNVNRAEESPTLPDTCPYSNDGFCDEPTYCPVGTDTTDCSTQDTHSFSQAPAGASMSNSNDNSCVYAFDGRCDEPSICEPGTDTDDCARINLKFADALGGESLELVIIGYTISGVIAAWRIGSDLVSAAGQNLGTLIDGLNAQNSSGQVIQLEMRTDSATVEAAREGRLDGASPAANSGNVGVSAVDYINQRAAEGTRADGMTCSPAQHAVLNQAKNDLCKGPPRKCSPKRAADDVSNYCADIQTRIFNNRQCVNARETLNNVCYGGLGHPDANGVRTEHDEATEQAKNALNKCLRRFAEICQ